jgi:Shugoshin C terminus
LPDAFKLLNESKREFSRGLKQNYLLTSRESQRPTEAIDIHVEPETLAAPDLVSPQSSVSLTIRAVTRDTPPPSELGSGAEGQRPSRRSKGSVSYAEPNLRDKMRRQTKELVDAVTGEGKNQRVSLSKVENDAFTVVGKIKEESEVDDTWKSLPSASSVNVYSKSPLVNKDQSVENSFGQRRRNGSSTQPCSDCEQPSFRSSSAISALLAGPRKAKEETKEQNQTEIPLEKALAKLDIYEFNESSPGELGSTNITGGGEDKYSSRTSRKLSTAAQDSVSSADKEELGGGLGTQKMASSLSSHRRRSMVGLGAVSTTDLRDHKARENALKKSHSSSALMSAVDSNIRSDRVSARRRSTML